MTKNILLIEDEALVGTMVQMNLEAQGYTVTWCKDGKHGLEASLAEYYHLVLLDISLPELDGLSLLGKLREANASLPIIMLTAQSEVETKVLALQKGADDYIAKPFDIEELLARVQAVMRRFEATTTNFGGHNVSQH